MFPSFLVVGTEIAIGMAMKFEAQGSMTRILSVPSGIAVAASRRPRPASADFQTTQRVWRRTIAVYTHPRRRGGRLPTSWAIVLPHLPGDASILARFLPNTCSRLNIRGWSSAVLRLFSFLRGRKCNGQIS